MRGADRFLWSSNESCALRLLFLGGVVALAGGCDSAPGVDAGPEHDGGLATDAGGDAGGDPDGGPVRDGGRDAGTDGGSEVDAAPPVDAGPALHHVVIRLLGEGEGSVLGGPFDCDRTPEATCVAEVPEGTMLALEASAADGSVLVAWSGDAADCAGGLSCAHTVLGDAVLAVGFARRDVRLDLAVSGPGEVAVGGAGDTCDTSCARTFAHGDTVVLFATPDVDSRLGAWTDACAGTIGPTCVLTLTADTTAGAGFATEEDGVTVIGAGTGAGTVTSSPAGIDCPGDCDDRFTRGTMVTLSAAALAGSDFEAWFGDCAGPAAECILEVDASRIAVASFRLRRYPLTVTREGDGHGTVSADEGGIACGSDCAGEYGHGATVTLRAEAAESSTFDGWGGACASQGTLLTCEVAMADATEVTASFLLRRHLLEVTVEGEATGTVSSSPAGIACGTDCEQEFDHGTSVTLTASASGATSRFAGWGGSCEAAGTSRECVLAMTEAKSAIASFEISEVMRFSETDRHALIRLRSDGLAVDFHTQGGVRSDRSVAPGSGVFYFEGRRLTNQLGPYGIGVATASLPTVGAYVGMSDQSFGLNVDGGMTYDSAWVGNFEAANDHYGFVVDYRGASPTVHLIVEIGGVPSIRLTQPMPAVTTPLFVFAAGEKRTPDYHLELNPGNDTVNLPFTYDAETILRAAGRTAEADALVLGFGHTFAGVPDAPTVLDVSPDQTVASGTPVTVTVSAFDAEDGDVTASVEWELLSSPAYAGRERGTGGSFSFTPTAIGRHPARARVLDAAGHWSTATVMITVSGSVTQHANPRLVPDGSSGPGIQLRADARAARWTGSGKMGVRVNQSIYGQFWYFEITRLVAPVNQGGGLVIGAGNLGPYDWADVPGSMSINTSGAVWRNIIWQANFPSPSTTYTTYGFAVDYRGTHPRVYVILAGQVVREVVLDDVWVELHPMIYGNPTGLTSAGEYDEAINLGASAFVHDATTALTMYGVATSGFSPYWGDANAP